MLGLCLQARTVVLKRAATNASFGFSIAQASPDVPTPYRNGAHIINKLNQGTSAERLLNLEDEVFEVEGINVTNISHKDFIQLVVKARRFCPRYPLFSCHISFFMG